jgi:hypothetical protein
MYGCNPTPALVERKDGLANGGVHVWLYLSQPARVQKIADCLILTAD